MIIQTLVQLAIFCLLTVIIFYSLGFLVLRLLKVITDDINEIILAYALGIVVFVLLVIGLGFFNVRFLMLPITLGILIYNLVVYIKVFLTRFRGLFRFRYLLPIILLGVVIQGLINFPSGYSYNGELLFWSSQGHDGLWHVALMEEFKKGFPPQNPIYSGDILVNYHYLGDVLMGEFYRIFGFFSALDLYFRFFPVLFAFLMNLAAFCFLKSWKKSETIGYLGMLSVSCIGSLGFIVTYLKHGNIFSGETVFWVSQNNTILGNPPHALGFILLISFFLAFWSYLQSYQKRWLIICLILGLILSGIKVSGAIVLLIGLGFVTVYEVLIKRRFQLLLLTAVLGITNYITIKSLTRGLESFLIFEPWWFIRTMVVGGDRLDLLEWEHRRQHYLAQHTLKAYLRVIQLEGTSFLIFLIGNSGVRILGFWEWLIKIKHWDNFKNIDQIEILLFGVMFSAFMIPMLFLQRGISFNIIQFMQYFLLVLGFYAAVTFYKLLNWKKSLVWRLVVILLIGSLALPTVIGNLVDFYGPNKNPLSKISTQELEALTFIKNNSGENDIILNMSFNKYLNAKYKTQPLPIYAWYSTAYIPAIAARRTYLSDEEQAQITGFEIEEKRKNMNKFFSQVDIEWNKQFLKDESIDYIYVAKPQLEVPPLDPENNGLNIFFQNPEVIVYKVI